MMKMNKIALSILAVCVGFSTGSLASGKYDDDYDDDDDKYYSSYSDSKYDDSDYSSSYSDSKYDDSDDSDGYKDDDDGDKKRLALNLVGTGEMKLMKVPPLEKYGPPLDAQCFDVELRNIHDGEKIGWARDCLSNITDATTGGDGVSLIGTTFFYLEDGLLITRGETTVRPRAADIVTADGQNISHITGASSNENAIVKGDGEYKWHKGTVRLSGMVDLTKFVSGEEGSKIFFDCLFIIDLEKYVPKLKTWYDWYRYRYYRDRYYEEYHSDSYYGKHDDSNDGSDYDDSDDGHDSYDDKDKSNNGKGYYKRNNNGKGNNYY
ncbi:hypothetical protein [Photobacterium rosenbergii]|uniref:hypothetical protein n=1 Tax=Photobacterium rosenbergii TaxID=294936 RepID=UPI001C9A070F|nr:hypothetical protein [Photobacterium rosenbergii]MBY5944045.1 hypothetical protein [Photobacterium rosenbergii]